MKVHPRVVVTRGWFLGPASCVGRVGGSRNQHYDSLVALEMAVLETRGCMIIRKQILV